MGPSSLMAQTTWYEYRLIYNKTSVFMEIKKTSPLIDPMKAWGSAASYAGNNRYSVRHKGGSIQRRPCLEVTGGKEVLIRGSIYHLLDSATWCPWSALIMTKLMHCIVAIFIVELFTSRCVQIIRFTLPPEI